MKEIIKSYVFTNILIFLTVCVLYACNEEPIVQKGKLEYKTRIELKEAMKYHGLVFAKQDKDTGKWYFERNGEKINLFNNNN